MRENQSLIDLIGWGLIAAIVIGAVMLFSSCTVPRLAGPTVDDLAGSPMVYGVSPYKVTAEWKQYGDIYYQVDTTPCDHFYIKQAHTVTDTIQAESEYQACICIYCKEINVCK